MSVSVPPEVEGRPAPFCALCGSPMEADQEWCLECGAGRTIIARPPDWRVPLLVIGVVVILIAAGLVFAITQLSDHAGKVTVINVTTTAQRSATVGTWPPGLDGYTVLLAAEPTHTAAQAEASRLLAAGASAVGTLEIAQHPEMRFRGPWLVYTGRYPTYALARAAAGREVTQGQTRAVPALVQRPGQG